MIKSDYEEILKEDCEQFEALKQRFNDLLPEDVDGAYALMKDAWAAAQRWSDIQVCVRKIKLLANRDIHLTEFRDFAYQRHRQLVKLHEAARIIWKQANDYLMWERELDRR